VDGVSNGPAGVYLGVDAGNSKTVAVLADHSGAVLGYGRSGCGDIYGVATEALAVTEVVTAVRQALEMASEPGRPLSDSAITHAAFCLAGIDWPSDVAYWQDQLTTRLPGMVSYSLRNDGFALLRAGAIEGRGVAVSAGTGAAIVARGPAGAEWSGSMWIVDALGGRFLGEQAFAAVIRAELGFGPATALRELMLARYGFAELAALLEATTSRGVGPKRHAVLARDVLDAAGRGDSVGRAIVDGQAAKLAQYAAAAARQVGLVGADIPVVLGGSVLSSENPALRDATTAALAQTLPTGRVLLTPRSPVLGAVAEAIAEGAGQLTSEVVDRLSGHAFPRDFLLT
jgi:N-acetylglucosamine kinase-like BadF-type ATPase